LVSQTWRVVFLIKIFSQNWNKLPCYVGRDSEIQAEVTSPWIGFFHINDQGMPPQQSAEYAASARNTYLRKKRQHIPGTFQQQSWR